MTCLKHLRTIEDITIKVLNTNNDKRLPNVATVTRFASVGQTVHFICTRIESETGL